LLSGLSRSISTRIKGAFDYAVIGASAGAFALSVIKEKYLEVDNFFVKTDNLNRGPKPWSAKN